MNLRPPGYEPDELPTALPRDVKLSAASGTAPEVMVTTRVMSPTSYQTALPRDIGTGDRSRTGTGSLPQDFKSRASTNSATPACYSSSLYFFKCSNRITHLERRVNPKSFDNARQFWQRASAHTEDGTAYTDTYIKKQREAQGNAGRAAGE